MKERNKPSARKQLPGGVRVLQCFWFSNPTQSTSLQESPVLDIANVIIVPLAFQPAC